jgi:glycosyltransferase involved in cell wall biosynthesis
MIIVQNNPESLKRSLPGRIIFFLAKQLYSNADAFISLSEGVAGSYQKAINIKKDIVVIPNIGNLNPSNIKENKERFGKKIRLLAVGRLEVQKDYPTMLHAFAKTVKKNPEKLITLTILGNGSQQNKLIELSKELKITDLIYFKGFISDTAIFYKNADILLLSSKWEGFGNVIVEAMSYALPVIGTDCPYGPSEIIQHGKNGFLTEVGNSKSISDYISFLINDDLLYQKMSESAYKSSLQFRGKVIASKYLNIIEKTI